VSATLRENLQSFQMDKRREDNPLRKSKSMIQAFRDSASLVTPQKPTGQESYCRTQDNVGCLTHVEREVIVLHPRYLCQ
jgi:hypothetical protein